MSLAGVTGASVLIGNGWRAEVLPGAPLIAPARRFIFPFAVAGEEDALARGALWLRIQVDSAGAWLGQCALGFSGAGVAHGLWELPGGFGLLACAGGYGYVLDPCAPERTVLLPPRPVAGVIALPERTVLVTHHGLVVREASGEIWSTPRLSWEGVSVTSVEDGMLCGMGWDMAEDVEVAFAVDLGRRTVVGGGFRVAPADATADHRG